MKIRIHMAISVDADAIINNKKGAMAHRRIRAVFRSHGFRAGLTENEWLRPHYHDFNCVIDKLVQELRPIVRGCDMKFDFFLADIVREPVNVTRIANEEDGTVYLPLMTFPGDHAEPSLNSGEPI